MSDPGTDLCDWTWEHIHIFESLQLEGSDVRDPCIPNLPFPPLFPSLSPSLPSPDKGPGRPLLILGM